MSGPTAWLSEERETYLLGLARVAFALILAAHVVKLASGVISRGYFGDYFHVPLLPEAWVPSRSVYLALLAVQAGAALLAAAGHFARPALLLASSIGLYLLCCDRLGYHNNRYVLYLLLFVLAFTPCDRSFRLGKPKLDAQARRGPIWAQRLLQAQVTLVYLASAISKLLDADWRGGQVLLVRFEKGLTLAIQRGYALPSWIGDLLRSPEFAELAAKAAITSELFIGLGLWFGPTRALALWLGVLFHLGIEFGARVEIFSFLMWAAYLSFVVPELGERKLLYDPSRRSSRAFAHSLRYLDWLARFEITPALSPTQASTAWGLSVIHRDGRRSDQSLAVLVLVSRCVPLFFPLWLPLAALHGVTRRQG